MTKDDDDESFDELDVEPDSDLPVHEEFVGNKKIRKAKKAGLKNIRRKAKKAGLKNIRKF